jgi:sigma-B regulation protein RsbU (phosphoserine phosphatase)
LSIGLAHLLTKSFITPLLNLQEGALAIENRNFKHRLTNLNIDEFGEVGGIFNHVMVGLEELEIAKIVQESMFPNPEFKQGKFSIYGKSITMIDVGGDYLDFFKVDDNSFSVLVGDVAGHGVGAAVIMAMAKAAILGADKALRSPALLLNSLHKMILATKNSKQKKIMTFQYLHINSETGENLYGNAGACSPWLIRHSENTVTEIKMAGAALGAFKRAVYKEMPLDFKPGDAIVFYTDGIVECKDKNGEMLGYERLKKLLLQNWDSNPETYYNNIYKAYLDFVGDDSEAGDDLTFVILVYNQEV